MRSALLQAKHAVYDPPCGDGKYILTPLSSPGPRINGARVCGVRAGSPFLYRIPVSGERPMLFSVDGLPDGLVLDRTSGIISGTITDCSEHTVHLDIHVWNRHGKASREFTVRVGDNICLTPPMGWNSWNCWGPHVTQQHVLDSAQAIVASGLADYGWNYINMDDGWQGVRGGAYNAILPDPEKFPNIERLCDQIHSMGLKVGIYSTPWVATYAGYVGGSSDHPDGEWCAAPVDSGEYRRKSWYCGKYFFEKNDVAQWADWGIDYLKYDWNPNDPENTLRMARELRNCGRDIIYSISNGAPLEHADLYAREVHCWRTTGDLKDRWDQNGSNLNLLEVWSRHRMWMEEGARGGPGHFPDADMLVVGNVVENNRSEQPRPSSLTADEQYAHVSLWALWSSPLLIGCPVETMDEFTRCLLTNSDVIDIHQDLAAVPGRTVYLKDDIEIVVKNLADGSTAVGLFNRNSADQVVTLSWRQAAIDGSQTVVDVWRQKEVGVFEDCFSANVRGHGVVLVRMRPQKSFQESIED